MRGKKAPVRKIEPDYKYNSVDISKFINYVMYDGEKSVARILVYKALDKLAEFTGEGQVISFEKAINSIRPNIEVRSRRVGGATYQVPTPVRENRSKSLAYRWIINSARDKRNNTRHETWETLAQELHDAYKGEGSAMKKRDEMHRMADANKAFAHLAW